MNYTGKLYGAIGPGEYFDTGKNSDDWDKLESERKEANAFITDIAELLKMDADGIGFDGLTLSIDDFKEGINKLESQVKLYKPLADEYMEGKKDIEIENKKLKESIESLLVLIDYRLELIDSREVGKGKSIIWNRVVKTAQDLINKLKQ